MNTKLLNLLWILLLAMPAPAQTTSSLSYHLLTIIPIETKFVATDKLQHIYAVTPKNEVIKYAADGRELYRFSNNTLGDLFYIDTTDPFNLLLYYPDYQLIITLDRTLNKTGELSLVDASALQVNAIGLSNDGNIWLYDEANFRLRKVDQYGQTLAESQNMSLLLIQAPRPAQLVARENRVYLADPTLGILVFNNFGQYDKTIDLKGVSAFQVLENRLVFQKKTKLKAYDFKSFLVTEMALPEGVETSDQVQIQKNRLFVKKPEVIEIYAF